MTISGEEECLEAANWKALWFDISVCIVSNTQIWNVVNPSSMFTSLTADQNNHIFMPFDRRYT
jgi:hypothetical protein